jgi:hypothetical protein
LRRFLQSIFGSKKDEVTGEWRRLHNEEFNDLYSPKKYDFGDQIKKNEMGRSRSTCGGGGTGDVHAGFGGET